MNLIFFVCFDESNLDFAGRDEIYESTWFTYKGMAFLLYREAM
jgi:hypothetical protein